MRDIDKDILDSQLFQTVLEDIDPIFKATPKSYDIPQEEEDVIFSVDEKDMQHAVQDALNASRGVRKLLKGLYGDQATVSVRQGERPLLEAIGRVFGEERDTITFDMYERCLEVLKEQAQKLAQEVL